MDDRAPILKIEMQVTEETYQRIRHVTYPHDLPIETSVFNKDFLQNLLVFIERRQDDPDSGVEIGSAIIDVTDWKNEPRSAVHGYGIVIDNWLTVYQPDPRKQIFTVTMDFSQVDLATFMFRYMLLNTIMANEVQALNVENLKSMGHTEIQVPSMKHLGLRASLGDET